MKKKYTVLAVLGVFLVLLMNSRVAAVNVRDIDMVRGKEVLDNRDFRIIDNFVSGAVWELARTVEFSSVSKMRTIILSRKNSATASAAAQYEQQFSESVRKHISEVLEQSLVLTPKKRRFKTLVNLLILVDGLEDPQMTDLAIARLGDENTSVRYWAIHCLTNPGLVKQLNSGETRYLLLGARIAGELKKIVKEAGPEETALMAEFAAEIGVRGGEELLLQIADERISRYLDWTVEYELLEMKILQLLYDKISSLGANNPAVARRFSQLYSCVAQRYVKGQDILSDTQKQGLASVLVEGEKSYISRLMRMPQSVIKRAVEQDSYKWLLAEHDNLLGTETTAGKLAEKLGFDYGSKSNGSKRTAPLAVPEPPQAEDSK